MTFKRGTDGWWCASVSIGKRCYAAEGQTREVARRELIELLKQFGAMYVVN